MIARISTLLFSVLTLLCSGPLGAELQEIRLSGTNRPSCWSLEEIVSQVTAGAGSDREKALALHEFGMAHQIHFIGPYENGDYVADALKLLSVYGYDLCGDNSSAMCALYSLAGLKARRRGLVGHVVPEVWFEGKWNYIDTDMFGYVFLDDKQHLASVDELIADPDLWTRAGARRPSPFFPWDPPESMKKAFIHPEGWKDCHPFSLAHSMNLGLRTRESLTCYYRPQATAFYHLDSLGLPKDLSTQYRDYWIQGPVRADSRAWTDTLPAAYGNACFEYAPDLLSEAFSRENPERENVLGQAGDGAPPLVSRERGKISSLVVALNSPWVITGRQNDLIDFSDNSGGAVVRGWFWRAKDTDRNSILVSSDNGLTWTKVWENTHLGAVPFDVDFTPRVDGSYGYRIKFEWLDNGGNGKVGLEGLSLETWAELSPMALPHMEPGGNILHLSTGGHSAVRLDRYACGQGALPGESLDNLAPGATPDILRLLDPSKPGSLMFGLGASGIVDELRVAVFAIRAGDGQREDCPEVVLSLSENGGAAWQELARFSPDPEHDLGGMWFNHIVKGRSLDGARARLKVQVSGGSLARVSASSLVRENPGVPVGLRVSHRFRAGASTQVVSWNFLPGAQNTSYEVQAPQGVHNLSFRIEALPPEDLK